MKSSTSQCSFERARRTSASVLALIRAVVSSHEIFSNSSENISSSRLIVQKCRQGRTGLCHETVCLQSQSGFVCHTSGFHCLLESHGHRHRVAGHGYGCIHQTSGSSHLHGLGSMTGRSDTGIHDYRYVRRKSRVCNPLFVPMGAPKGMTVAAPASSRCLQSVGSA